MTGYDLIAMGRVGVDIYPQQPGLPLEAVQTFEKFLGGSAANVAVAAAHHGRRTALISRTADDALGRYLRAELPRLGVDGAFLGIVRDGPPTPVTFCEVFPPDNFPTWFYRYPTAPDLLIEPDSLPLEQIRRAGVYWSTLTGLCQEPSRASHFSAWEARHRRSRTVLDLDHRAAFWPDRDAAHDAASAALDRVTIAVGNRWESELATGESDPERALTVLLGRGLELAVIRLGPGGVVAGTQHDRVHVAPFPLAVVNGLGSGDAFGGALVHGLLAGWDLGRLIHFANVASAVAASRYEGATAMPRTAEVERLLVDIGVADDLV